MRHRGAGVASQVADPIFEESFRENERAVALKGLASAEEELIYGSAAFTGNHKGIPFPQRTKATTPGTLSRYGSKRGRISIKVNSFIGNTLALLEDDGLIRRLREDQGIAWVW